MVIHLLLVLLLDMNINADSGFGWELKGSYLPPVDFSNQICRTGLPRLSLLEENPEPQQKSGCLLTRWGVPDRAIEVSAAFAGGHIGGWLVSGTLLAIGLATGVQGFGLNILAWTGSGFFDGSWQIVELVLNCWNYVGVPAGATLTTIGISKAIRPGGKCWSAALGALVGDLAAYGMSEGYRALFGNPHYTAQGAPAPPEKELGFIYGICLPGSVLPAAGAVIGYNLSIPKVEEIEDTMSYQPSWTQQVREVPLQERSTQVSGYSHINFNLLRVRF
jgi:hypothetical protein